MRAYIATRTKMLQGMHSDRPPHYAAVSGFALEAPLLTDGKVFPCIASDDVASLLGRYKPDYWLANDAALKRPFLTRNLLREEVVDARGNTEGASIRLQGVTFTNIRTRTKAVKPGFAGYRQVHKLDYR